MGLVVEEMIKEWTEDVQALSKIMYDPQLVYTAYVFGTSKRWQYVCRTTPKISVLKKLEEVIKSKLIPKIIGKIRVWAFQACAQKIQEEA